MPSPDDAEKHADTAEWLLKRSDAVSDGIRLAVIGQAQVHASLAIYYDHRYNHGKRD